MTTTLDELECRDLALTMPLDGIGRIEASAGTGKTFTIAGVYARLVVEKKMAVRNILVMTFTRAACEELRTRLRERLQLCAALVDDPAGQPDGPEPATDGPTVLRVLALLRRVRRQGDEDDASLRRRIREAAQRMDEAAIFTIHGFCQRVLGEYAAWIDAGGVELQLEPSDADLLEDIAADLWLRVAAADENGALDALQVLADSPAQLARRLKDIVYFEGRVEPSAIDEDASARDRHAADQALIDAWRHDGNGACETFAEWLTGARFYKNKYPSDAADALCTVYEKLVLGQVPARAELEPFGLARLRGHVQKTVAKKKGPFPDLAPFVAIDRWLAAASQQQANLLQRLRDEARAMLAKRKRVLQRHSYDDLITHLRDALVGGDHASQAALAPGQGAVQGDGTSRPGAASRRAALVAHLCDQYRYAMVDEFQDTSARQWQILEALYGERGPLLMIGDPKQAIYGFRGGDVHTYLQAAKAATYDDSLPQNFRSAPALLEAIEAVFTARGDDGVFVDAGITFQPVTAGGTREGALLVDEQPVKPLTLWPIPVDAGDADQQRAMLARAAAVQIADLLDGRRVALEKGGERTPVAPGHIAVLVNKHAESVLVLDALRELNVPAVSVQKRSVFDTDEAHEMLRLLDALQAPESLRLARGALATVLLGQTLADLEDGKDAGRADPQLDRLAELRRIWQRRGVLAMLETVFEQRATALLALADGERRLANLMQLAGLLQQAGHDLAGPRALRDWLARRIRDADNAHEDEQLQLESDAECVQVMTLHASKGLEFDLVLLPFMGLRKVQQLKKGGWARFHDGDTAVKRLLLNDAGMRNDADRHALAEAQREQLAEDVRVLYVGITRARYACWMSTGVDGKATACGNNQDLPDKVLHWVLAPHPDGSALAAAHPELIARVTPPVTPAGTARSASPPTLGDARRFTRALRYDWWVHSFSQLNRGQRELQVDAPADHDEAADVTPATTLGVAAEVVDRPRGADYGSAVHAILEHTVFDAWRDAVATPDSEQDRIAQVLRQAGYGGSELDAAVDATGRLLCASMNTPCIAATRLVDIEPANRCAEMRFHFGIAGATGADLLTILHRHDYQRERARFTSLHGQLRGLMHGIIDLVCRVDGRWWVIDYKTNHLGDRYADYDAGGMQTEVNRAGYDLQYLIYTVAAHRWLAQLLGDAYDYRRDFGGVRYLFLRGMHPAQGASGVFADKPDAELVEQLDRLLAAPGRVAA